MKNVAFILAVIIFSQSLSVCGPTIKATFQIEKIAECKADLSSNFVEKKHYCCSKEHKSEKNNDDNDDKGCCGDACKCFCHAKIFVTEFSTIRKSELLVKAKADKNILPVFAHSYDFHPSVSYPPQV